MKFLKSVLFVLSIAPAFIMAQTSYTVQKGETLYAIARAKGITIQQIFQLNPGLQANPGVKAGQVIQLPAAPPVPSPAAAPASVSTPAVPVKPASVSDESSYPQGMEMMNYTVKPGESLWGISKQFHTTPEELKKWNPVLLAGLKAGQVLKVPVGGTTPVNPESPVKPTPAAAPETKPVQENKPQQLAPAPVSIEVVAPVKTAEPVKPVSFTLPEVSGKEVNKEVPVTATSGSFAGKQNDYKLAFLKELENGKKVQKVRGAAVFLEENDPGNPFLGLCNLVPSGTVVKVRNLMNGKSAYVKILGKLPQADALKEVTIKLTVSLRDMLATSDEKVLVELAFPGE